MRDLGSGATTDVAGTGDMGTICGMDIIGIGATITTGVTLMPIGMTIIGTAAFGHFSTVDGMMSLGNMITQPGKMRMCSGAGGAIGPTFAQILTSLIVEGDAGAGSPIEPRRQSRV